MQLKINCFFFNLNACKNKRMKFGKVKKHLNCTKLKCKWNFAIVEMKMKCCKIRNSNRNLQRIWNEIAFEIHWKLHREKVFDSNEKGFALAKTSQGSGGCLSQK